MDKTNTKPYIPIYEQTAILKAYKCSYCNRIYSTQVQANTIKGRIPLLMPCSHTICEECLVQLTKTKNVTCKICHYKKQIENIELCPDIFPVDKYMFGSLINLNANSILRSGYFCSGEKKLPFSVTPAGASLKNKKLKMNKNEVTIEEKLTKICSQQDCNKRADSRCINCSELYCSKCDKRVHESIRILRNHVRYPVDAADLAEFNLFCVQHLDCIGEYTCMTCDCMLCSKCVIKDHSGHEIISIEDKNAQGMDIFRGILQKGRHILKCLEFTQKKVKLEINNNQQNFKPNEIEFDITKHFSILHSRLQILEQQMLEEFSNAQTTKVDSLNRLASELESNIAIMRPLVATGNMVSSGDSQHLDKLLISELQKNIEDNLILPCELVEKGKKEIAEDNIQFVADEALIDIVQNHCRIKFEDKLSFKLAPITDFGERNFPSDETSITTSDAETIFSKSESETTCSQISYVVPGCKTRVSLAGSMPTVYGNIRKEEESKQNNESVVLVKDTVEQVSVTHINSPADFYVQLTRLKNRIDNLTNKYGIYAEHASTPTEPEIGYMYIVQFTTTKFSKWYRGLLRNLFVSESTIMYEIFFLDYGNIATVPLSKIRVIKPIFVQDPPFAYRCRLNGIISQRNEWNDDVLRFMVQFITSVKDAPLDPVELNNFLIYEIRNSTLKMHVIQNRKGFLDVDLFSHSASLSAYLMFLGCAQPVKESCTELPITKSIINNEITIMSGILNYEKNKNYQIHVSNIIDPHNIYIQLMDNLQVIKNLETAMTRFYSKKESRKMIFTPVKGSYYAAQLTLSNKNWWRVLVTDFPGDAKVEVFAIDYGITDIIPYSKLFKLRNVHKHSYAQTVLVSLSDIAPPKDAYNEWPKETIEFLRTYLENKNLTMYVNKSSKTKLMVTIYEQTKDTVICIDALLVRKHLAESTGESSLLVEFYKEIPGGSETKKRKTDNHLLPDVTETKLEVQFEMICGSSYFTAVRIKNIKSPGSFYVEFLKWENERVSVVHEMYKFYRKKVSPAKKWELNKVCVVKSKQDNKYYRAIITKILENNQYEVFLKDFIRSEEVSTENLYELNKKFGFYDYGHHCCLGGIKPTGGTDKWSAKSIEEFNDFVEQNNELYITKNGNTDTKNKVLIVKLLTAKHTKPEALEPSKTEVIILNDELIEKGLAYPDKRYNEQKMKETLPPTLPQIEFKNASEATLQKEHNDLTKLFETKTENPFSLNNTPTSSMSQSTSWLPPIKITEKQFKAYPCYVDFEANIYFHTEKTKKLFSNVKRILNQHFKNSYPDTRRFWEEGQMVSARYYLDKCFYRATIIETRGDGKILVHFIDFGNQEEVTHEDIRSEVLAIDVPTLAQKCNLSNISPTIKFTEHILDRLHFTIVDKEVLICTDEEEIVSNETAHVRIYVQNECINEIINSLDLDDDKSKIQDSDNDNSVIIEEVIDNQDIDVEITETSVEDISQIHEELYNSDLKYRYVLVPNKKNFEAVVINLLDYRTIILEGSFAAKLMTETKEQFNTMSDEINIFAPELSQISSPVIGLPCIALYDVDGKWYRAEILDIGCVEYDIKVLFVDYGNVETVSMNEIRVIKHEWLQFPVSMIKCKLWGIKKSINVDTLEVYEAMKKAIIDKHVICHIQSYIPDLEVKLIDEDSYELTYKQLLTENIIENFDENYC